MEDEPKPLTKDQIREMANDWIGMIIEGQRLIYQDIEKDHPDCEGMNDAIDDSDIIVDLLTAIRHYCKQNNLSYRCCDQNASILFQMEEYGNVRDD